MQLLSAGQVEMLKADQVEIAKRDQTEIARRDQTEMLKADQTEIAKRDQIEIAKRDQTEMLKADQTEMLKADQIEIAKRDQIEIARRNQIEIAKRDQIEIAKRDQIEIARRNQIEIAKRDQIEIAKRDQIEIAKRDQIEIAKRDQIEIAKRDQFQKVIYDFYTANKRNFIWRDEITPYKVLVSEIMLQQTQTARVVPKFKNWLEQFPDFATLAAASNHDILTAWQGLGYNRRGLALGKIAQIVMTEHSGQLPNNPTILQTFPAIGPNTAGSICAFAFNHPIVFIETNIRTVYTDSFFKGQTQITDKQLLPLIEQTIDHSNPRQWYYALMDYGVHLKQKLPKINAASKHYTRQSKFIGSKRQVRGAIIKLLTQLKQIEYDTLIELLELELPDNKHNHDLIIEKLIEENVVYQHANILSL